MKKHSYRVDADGLHLHVVTYGDRQKTPIVLVHGYPDNHRVWHPVAEILSARYFVIAYDVRGAGLSAAPSTQADYRMQRLAEDLVAVVDALIPGRRFHLAAHDWGSIQSWESVTGEALRPRIASFTSISGPCLDHVGYWLRERALSRSARQQAQLVQQALSSWYIGFFHLPLLAPACWKAGLDQLWPRYLARREGVGEHEPQPTQAADGYNGVQLYRANFRDKLLHPQPRYASCPVQLIVPLRDNYVGSQLFSDLQRWVPQLYRRDIDAGHWVLLSHPQLVAEAIDTWVSGLEKGQLPMALQRRRVQGERQHQPLAGQLALITGAGSGIGQAIASKFADNGADIVCVDIDANSAERSAEWCRLLGARAWARQTDVGSAKAMTQLARWVDEELGGADIVVNNAGLGLAGGILETRLEDWERLLKVNLWGVIHGSRLFAAQMVAAHRRGHIINVASAAAFAPHRQLTAYATSKAAVHMLSECLRAELAPYKIGVTAVCPGFVATGIAQATVYAGLGEAEQAQMRTRAERLYRRRNFSPDEVASAVLQALLSNRPLALVGAEAWATRLLSRFVPQLSRRIARLDLLG